VQKLDQLIAVLRLAYDPSGQALED